MKTISRIIFLSALLGVALGLVTLSKNSKRPGFGEPPAPPVRGLGRTTLNDRYECENGTSTEYVSNRANTTAQVNDLLVLMEESSFSAYIVPTSDAHNSEYTSPADKRRAFISGFTGSAGTAVILENGTRALWTDGRYWTQADQELDCTWILMEWGEPEVPSIGEWLLDTMAYGTDVGADSRLFTAPDWIEFEEILYSTDGNLTLVVETIGEDGFNIVDDVWETYGRPDYSTDPIFIHDIIYAGQEWRNKCLEVELEMDSYGAQGYIVSMLDESAWVFNLRGSDIPFNPVFRSYVLFDTSERSPPNIQLFIPDINLKMNQTVLDHLGINQTCDSSDPCVSLQPYDYIGEVFSNYSMQSSVTTIMIPTSASYFIYDLVEDEDKRLIVTSPIMLEKAYKNPVEATAMRDCHVKDATALYQFLYELEPMIKAGNYVTEMEAIKMLSQYRFAQEGNMGLSFYPVSAFGENSAIIHYAPTNDTDTLITGDGIYLIDSGGQYLDGTTDVTRTFHFGFPDDTMIEAYTRVLMGQIDMAALIFPKGFDEDDVDILTRRYLYEVGWDYNHSPTHGVGMFLNIHEDSSDDFELGWHGTDEPGVYLEGYFGIRLENQVQVVNYDTKYNFTEESYAFQTLTMFHYERNLINISLLTRAQCEWINDYYTEIQTYLEPINETLSDVYDYILEKTEDLPCDSTRIY